MAKKVVNSDIYNLSQLVDDVKSVFIPNETDETLAIGTYGYIGALESNRLQTQVQMTGELCNESFPSRARLERNIITHAIMANISDINAYPAKMSVYLSIREQDIYNHFNSDNIFVLDRECPIYIGDYEFHLEYDIKLKKINVDKKGSYPYTAQYDIPANRDVPTSTITYANQYLNPPVVIQMNNNGHTENYIMLNVVLSQVQHNNVSKKLVTSNIVDNKMMNFEFTDQLAYFEVHCTESDEEYYVTPVFEGSAVPEGNSQYYCWYQYIDTNLIRIRFDRKSYMPGLNANVECLIKTTKGEGGNFTYGEDVYITLESSKYGYRGINVLLTPVTESSGGKNRKTKKELQSLIPKESLSRGSLTTITDLNNYFSMLDSELGRIIIQKKIDNQIERVYYAYLLSKDLNGDVIPSNTIDIKVPLEALIYSKPSDSDSPRYLLKSGSCFKLGDDGIGYLNTLPLLGTGEKFIPKAAKRGSIVEASFTVSANDDILEKNAASVAVSIEGNETSTHIFPADGDDRFAMVNSSDEVLVEDFIQMGVGKNYNYQVDYVVQNDNPLITVRDKNLDCLDLVEGSYTYNGTTKYFNSLPIIAYDLEKGTKITFNIKRKLNEKAKGIIYFSYNGKVFKLHQKTEVKALSTILYNLGITTGEVTDAISSDESILQLIENEASKTATTVEDTTIDPYKLRTVKESELPDVENRKENEWFYVVDDENADTSATQTDAPYKLNVEKSENMPDVESRDENNWYYNIQKATNENGDVIDPDIIYSDKDYILNVEKSESMPPVEDREENNYWYNITNSEARKEIPDDPDYPDEPTELTGKDYSVRFIKPFDNAPVSITVTVDGVQYIINISQNRFLLENTMYISEGDVETQRTAYTTYMPVLDQNRWPSELNPGDQVEYTLRYISLSNTYIPDIIIKLSEGLDYVLFSNKVRYPDGSEYQIEPAETSIADERGFLYTNPYASNINAFKLYSSFYMMSIEENPYLKFTFVNDKSNVQFISTNAYWTRPFTGSNKDVYTLNVSVTQSVQANLGVDPRSDEAEIPPLVKVIAVFQRDGKDYRYRSLKYNAAASDKGTLTYAFTQDFYSLDKFDNSNNIEVANVQVTGQEEYKVTLRYGDIEYTINNGGSVSLNKILNIFGITLDSTLTTVVSDISSALSVYPVYDDIGLIIDHTIVSYNDFSDEATITLTTQKGTEYKISATSTQPAVTEYGYFNPITGVKIYILCGIPDIKGKYSKEKDIDSICPGLTNWTLTNSYEIVNGVTMYHNYSEIMGSRVIPYGKNLISKGPQLLGLEGFYIKGVPMLGYDYCQNPLLVQSAIDALNYKKAYIDSAINILENSFGIDFKLFNTYGPSKTYYIIKDVNKNNELDDQIEFIDRVNLTFYFRIKLVATNDSYTRSNIITEIKNYIEDLDDLGELHIPNLVTQITTNYREQIQYFEYLGFNNYGPGVQHIYKLDDSDINIHDAPEFLNINNNFDIDGTLTPDINIYVSEI